MAYHAPVAGERPTAAQWLDWVFRRCIADFTSSTRPSSPLEGQPGFETDTDKLIIHDGSSWIELGKVGAWTSYTPTWATAGTPPALGNGTLTGRYQRLFGRVLLTQIAFLTGSTTTFGTGLWSFTQPASLNVVTPYFGVGYAGCGADNWPVIAQCSGNVVYPHLPTSTTNPRLSITTATVPATWTTSNSLYMTILSETST